MTARIHRTHILYIYLKYLCIIFVVYFGISTVFVSVFIRINVFEHMFSSRL